MSSKTTSIAGPRIATYSHYAYHYARDVIKGRWPEAEVTIAKSPKHAYLYARDVIKGRWPEAEAVIAADPSYAKSYNEFLEEKEHE